MIRQNVEVHKVVFHPHLNHTELYRKELGISLITSMRGSNRDSGCSSNDSYIIYMINNCLETKEKLKIKGLTANSLEGIISTSKYSRFIDLGTVALYL